MRRVSMIALVTLVALIAAPAFAVTITLGSDSVIRATAYDGTTYANPFNDSLTLPDSGTVFANGDASSASTDYSLSNTGFDLTFTHARNALKNAVAESSAGLYFSVDSEVGYELEGFYNASAEIARRITMEVVLKDVTEGHNDILFRNLQQSEATASENFTLETQEGDTSNVLLGLLTGTLVPDHDYLLTVRTNIWNTVTGAASTANAYGEMSLTFVPVPEPSTALLLAAGLAGLAVAGRRRRL